MRPKGPETGTPASGGGAASSAHKVKFWHSLHPRVWPQAPPHTHACRFLLNICCIPLQRRRNEEANQETNRAERAAAEGYGGGNSGRWGRQERLVPGLTVETSGKKEQWKEGSGEEAGVVRPSARRGGQHERGCEVVRSGQAPSPRVAASWYFVAP